MASFDEFISSIIADGNDGKAFELFCKHFLETAPEYKDQFEKVWLWDQWPNKWSHDKGIDLIAKYKGRDTYCAIQAKCYAAHNTVPYDEVTNFLADSNRSEIEDRILMMSTNRLYEKTSKEVIQGQEKQVVIRDRHYFESINFNYPSHISELSKASLKPKAEPRKHQVKAIADVENGLTENDRGQLIMACGTGKTFTTLWIKERLRAHTVLVLLPSLSLLSQIMREWVWGASEQFEALAVCSDPTVGKSKKGDEDISTAEVGKVTWHVEKIKSFLTSTTPKVIFCTYQSSELIEEAQRDAKIPAFDLVVCDEAHRCAGKSDAGFATVLHDDKIRAMKRLFTTATPRYYGKSVKSAAEGRGVEIIGMDDERKFGPVLHKLTFGQAIELDMLTDYQVVVVGVDEPMVRDWIADGEIISTGKDHITDARTLAAKIAVLKAIKDYDLTRVISFHGNIKRAKDFAQEVEQVSEIIDAEQRPSGKIWSEHVDGTMSAGKRRDLINNLKGLEGFDVGLLTNARCLSEGVDVPSLDGIAFVDPRGSQVDIIQAVGRAIRKSENKAKGTIVLPVFLEEGDDPDTIIDASNFKPVWDVLKALRAHDEVLADELDQYRTDIGVHASRQAKVSDKIITDLPFCSGIEISSALQTRIVEAVTENWYFWLGLLQRYSAEFGTALVPDKAIYDKSRLGTWVANQRSRKGRLSEEKIKALESVSGWSWDPISERWDDHYNALVEYVAKNGWMKLKQKTIFEGLRLGQWVSVQRVNKATLDAKKIKLLELIPEWSWNSLESRWIFFYSLLIEFTKTRKTLPKSSEIFKNERLGQWVGVQRRSKNSLPKDRIEVLEALDGWSWDARNSKWNEHFVSLERFISEFGRMPFDKEDLGSWISRQRRLHKAGKLAANRRSKLEALTYWSWEPKLSAGEEYFNTGYAHLLKFYEKFSHCNVKMDFEIDSYKLGRWVVNIRQKRQNLEEDQIDKLQRLSGWVWNSVEAQWELGFMMLTAFVKREKHASPPQKHCEDDFALGVWISRQRAVFKKGKMTAERIKRLQSVPGWVWDAKK